MKTFIEQLVTANEKLPHRAHQLVGVEQLIKTHDPERTAAHAGVTYARTIPKVFALLDEVGAGKSKQIVDSAQILYGWNEVDTVVVMLPGFARSTFASEDPTLGEVAKHAWDGIPNVVHEFHGSYTELDLSHPGLHWIISNYEFIRRDERRDSLIRQLKGRRVWLVLDEAWAIKGNSDQMRACWMIRRKRADYVTILNGTPLADGKPTDLYYPFAILDPGIIGCKNKTHFKSEFCEISGEGRVTGYKNLEVLNARIAPYVLSRRTRDCFDLPPMLPPITIEARLTEPTWKIYRAMRDDMVAWLGSQASVSSQAITKALRLSQICSGFLGGLEDVDPDAAVAASGVATKHVQQTAQPVPSWLRAIGGLPFEDQTVRQETPPQGDASVRGQHGGQAPGPAGPGAAAGGAKLTREVGREKLDAFLFWLSTLGAQPDKFIAWCRFRPELERMTRELKVHGYPLTRNLWGKQPPADREEVKRLLAPGGDPRRCGVVGITGTGAASLNFAAAWLMVFMSHDPALIKRTQSIGRVERPGATQPMLIVDVVATGPKGQKTFDHACLKALRAKHDMATWTVQQWRDAIKEE